ncbi:MAG: hypothetical protein SFY69_06045 [Planctomycetota bacterium]|nr:hypothetical protein [Planctomycetota bacterium]
MTETIIVMVLVVVIGVPFTLWWWRVLDKFLPAHQRRFAPPPPDSRERIVVKSARADHPSPSPENRP